MTVQFEPDSTSHIQWTHIDGPLFIGKDGCFHWLTLLERLMFKIGALSISDLERMYNHGPQRG